MRKQFTTQRKWSAAMAIMLGIMVTFMAAIQSFGTTEPEELIVYDIKGSLDRAYAEVIEEEFDFELPATNLETIKIYGNNDELVLTIVKEKGGVIENEKAQRLLNKAEYLADYSNTYIYRLEE
ncbi:hypothetical protein [Roseivirga sp.]|uniref:hypothetical protein n=1 Tax=Roseivirga sp. TaxID=1964215 RepID=UPI003B518BA0